MHSSRLWRLAAACRPVFQSVVLITSFAVGVSAADAITGIVVDPAGQPLPRAFVRTLDPSGKEAASTFADETGHFRLTPASSACRVEVSMSGFSRAEAACASTPLRVVLQVAPIAETVIVTATRTEAPADQTGASVTVFTAADLDRRQVPLVADLLRSTPGAMLIRTGGLGTVTSLFVRGGESNYNKVLLDGMPLNEPGGTFNFSNLTTENLERIEVVRGAQSALFGSDAMASVVQLFTKRPDGADERPHASVSLEGGTYDTVRGGASVSGASGRATYTAGVSRFTTDNREPNNRFENTSLSANFGVALSDTATLRVIARGEREHVGTPGQTAFGRPDMDAFFERHDGTGGVTFDQQLTARFRQRAIYSLAVSNYQSTNLVADPPYTPRFENRSAPFQFSDFTFDSRTKLRRHHASYQADWRLTSDASVAGDHRLTLLADWDGERATLIDQLASTNVPASRNNSGLSVQHQALWARTFVTVGARVEHNDSFGTAAVPRGSIVYVARTGAGPVGDTRLRASAGLGIKEPTVLQSFSPSPFFHGNPDLLPERSRTFEAGVEQRFASDRARVELTWFDNRFRNLIATRTTNPATFAAEYFNIGLTQARGAELAIDVAPLKVLRARGGYTFLSSEILESTSPSSAVFKVGQSLFRRPRQSGFVGVSWVSGPIVVDVNGVFIGTFVDSDFASLSPPILTNPGHTTWDGRLAYLLTKQVRAFLSIDNLADADYMEPLGYPALRRAVRAGVRVTF
jgi:outer membrane cobalamin receptor